jgi:hypothetical protein
MTTRDAPSCLESGQGAPHIYNRPRMGVTVAYMYCMINHEVEEEYGTSAANGGPAVLATKI